MLLLLSACAPGNQNQLLKEGKTQLTAEQLFQLVSGNTLHLESIDFNAWVHLLEDGRMSAKNRQNQRDTGVWDINSDSRLCLKFESWYYGDERCYSLIAVGGDDYVLFTSNGARAYSATAISGDSENLAAAGRKKGKTYLRDKMAGGKSAASGINPARRPVLRPARNRCRRPGKSPLPLLLPKSFVTPWRRWPRTARTATWPGPISRGLS